MSSTAELFEPESRSQATFVPGDPPAFDRNGMRRFLVSCGYPGRHVRDTLSRVRRVIEMIGPERFFWLNPYADELQNELSRNASYQRLNRIVRWQLMTAVREYQRYMRSQEAPYAEDIVLNAAGIDRTVLLRSDPGLFAAYMARIGLSEKNISDNLTRIKRVRKLLGIERFEYVTRKGVDATTDAVEKTCDRERLSPQVKSQLSRAAIYFTFFRNKWSIDDPKFPARRKQNGQCYAREVGFDRAGFREYLENQGIEGKKLSDRLTRVQRVARLVGSETFAQAREKPFEVKDALEKSFETESVKNDIRGQLLRALRDYVVYLNKDLKNPDRVVVGLTESRAVKARGRPAGARTATPSSTGKTATPNKAPAKAKPKPKTALPRDAQGRPMTWEAKRAQEEAEIQAFMEKKGVTKCDPEIADGAIPLENLGID